MPISHSSTILMERILLLYAIMTERCINVGKIILKEIHDYARKKVASCITAHDLERLVENVSEINPTELSESTELETDESSNKFETGANSVTKAEEEESEEEPNNLEPIKEPEISELVKEPNVDELIEPSVDPDLTIPMPTSSNTMKK
ncbi:hypothetical protein J1N35_001174 [Gossypium stocksii]|uniref:Uncharacterized protein n=1 Tax=Gossypium stocksii TaxID=47602 RepID=A0A9D4AL46_9ROSI|nr:hypothetical protein J1N35_001174 [Gossypium stocksii]